MNLKTIIVLVPIVLAACAGSVSRTVDVVTEEVTYEAGGATCTGFIAYDASREGPRPGVLIVHEWWGHNDYVRQRARMLAELGYTAFALDMYGDGKSAEHPQDAQKFMSEVLANMSVGVARFEAAQRLLEQHATTDPERIAAIGYCFGGAVVLAMARQGKDLDAVASFHGSLATEERAKPGTVRARVLICHGGRDQMVPREQVAEVEQEMRVGGAPSVRTVIYEHAQHGFTNPDATAMGQKFDIPIGYDAEADAASWGELQRLLTETFR